ncbi:MAG: EAL domain-containing protein [Gammaproteobacteria bacterium]|nr:EAL domain-containing protein [Gammaproteobacteria bacterium]
MPTLVLLCVLVGLCALVLLVLLLIQRRQLRGLEELAQQLQNIAIGGSLRSRIDLHTDQPQLGAIVTAINHVLERAAPLAELPPPPPPPPASAPLAALGNRIHDAVLIHREAIVYANPQFAQLIGLQPAELVGRRLEDLVPPEYAELVGDNIRRRLGGAPAAERYEIDLIGLQGQTARLEVSNWPIEHEGRPALLVVGVEVLPAMSAAPTAPTQAERSPARLALESLSEAVLTTDAEGQVQYLNPAALRLLGTAAISAIGSPLEALARFVDETDRRLLINPVRQALTAGAPVNLGRRALIIAQPGGTERLVEVSAAPMQGEGGEGAGAVVLLHDVTEARGLTRQMTDQAAHDALTGLINRREFERRLQDAVDNAHRGDGTHVLCYLDLDRFKVVNDTSGHQAGDVMLREVAKLLKEAVRDSDTVARLGGDEFGMLLVGCPLDKARQIADDVCRTVADYRFVWKDKIFNIGVSVGLVELSRDSGSMEESLAAADSACYVAKRQGGHVHVYSARDEVVARQSGEIHWLQTLQAALRDNRFELHCQPIVPAAGNEVEGPAMEVLLRLRDAAGELLPTADFLQAAERYRLMGMIDRRVVQTTLTALGRGAIELAPRRSVSINVSGQTLADAQFLEFVVECLDSTGANPAQVCFEIAENAVIANLEHARRFIGVLHGMGCRFALDNFGSGLGSFSNLKNLAVDYLKIDGSFIRNLARDSVNQTMVSAMIRLARTLNFKVVAEQVEDPAALEAARRMGVDYLQGFAIGRPAPLGNALAA